MAKIIAIANQKGGVGKTTTTVNISASMAATKRKVLMVDLDPQGNATSGAGLAKEEHASLYEVMVENTPITEVITPSENAGYDVLPGNADLTAVEVRLMDQFMRETKLREQLKLVSEQYDFIFIDCPPSLNLLTVNALAAADSVIVPMQCEYFALEGLTALMGTIEQLADVVNPRLKIEGILRTMYDPRNRLSQDVSEQLKAHFGEQVYRTVIPRNVRLAEAPSHGLPAMYYDKSSTGAVAYLALAGEILRRMEAQQQEAQHG